MFSKRCRAVVVVRKAWSCQEIPFPARGGDEILSWRCVPCLSQVGVSIADRQSNLGLGHGVQGQCHQSGGLIETCLTDRDVFRSRVAPSTPHAPTAGNVPHNEKLRVNNNAGIQASTFPGPVERQPGNRTTPPNLASTLKSIACGSGSGSPPAGASRPVSHHRSMCDIMAATSSKTPIWLDCVCIRSFRRHLHC